MPWEVAAPNQSLVTCTDILRYSVHQREILFIRLGPCQNGWQDQSIEDWVSSPSPLFWSTYSRFQNYLEPLRSSQVNDQKASRGAMRSVPSQRAFSQASIEAKTFTADICCAFHVPLPTRNNSNHPGFETINVYLRAPAAGNRERMMSTIPATFAGLRIFIVSLNMIAGHLSNERARNLVSPPMFRSPMD